MARKVILAVAGSGKTYHICNALKEDADNLIIAFTHANVFNIERELLKRDSGRPSKTHVTTFDSFVFRYVFKPYAPQIMEIMGFDSKYANCECTLKDPPTKNITIKGR